MVQDIKSKIHPKKRLQMAMQHLKTEEAVQYVKRVALENKLLSSRDLVDLHVRKDLLSQEHLELELAELDCTLGNYFLALANVYVEENIFVGSRYYEYIAKGHFSKACLLYEKYGRFGEAANLARKIGEEMRANAYQTLSDLLD